MAKAMKIIGVVVAVTAVLTAAYLVCIKIVECVGYEDNECEC